MNLSDYRTQKGMTIKELGDHLGIKHGTLLGLLYGTRKPSAQSMHNISKLTGGLVTSGDFFDDPAVPTDPNQTDIEDAIAAR